MTDNIDGNAIGQTDEFFGSLRFYGDRFKFANLPLELLSNVKAYQDLLLAIAEDIWRERNPERTRLPQGFKKSLSLSFSHIEDGSARAVLRNDLAAQNSLLSDEYAINYLALAQSRFLELSKAANENRPIISVSGSIKKPAKILIANLREGEGLEVVSLTGKDFKYPSVRYSEKTMRALTDAAESSRTSKISGIGIIRAILDSTEEIEVLSEHGTFRLPVPSSELRGGRYPIAAFLEFDISAVLSPNGLVKQVIDAYQPTPIKSGQEHLRFLKRLDELTKLQPGWKDGCGEPISERAARFCYDLSGFICEVYKNVSLFPEIDGSLLIEFSYKDLDVTVVCKSDQVRLEVYDDSDDDPVEKTFFGLGPKLISNLLDLEDLT